MNWLRTILLMLPIRLRKSRFFFALIYALTAYTRKKYDEQEAYIKDLISQMRYTSQYKSLKALLKYRFEENVEIVDDEQLDNITFVLPDNLNENSFLPMLVRPDKDVFIKRNFIILVPVGVDTNKVREFVERYVFCGIYFEVREK